eukprot:9575715-Ditylum_brightwellii.AAC.1
MDLEEDNTSSRVTLYRSGLPIDSISGVGHAPADSIKQYQSRVGSLTWLLISTCPDLSSVISFLSSFNHKPSLQYMAEFKHVDNNTATSYLNLPFKEDSILPLCDANWAPKVHPKTPL